MRHMYSDPVEFYWVFLFCYQSKSKDRYRYKQLHSILKGTSTQQRCTWNQGIVPTVLLCYVQQQEVLAEQLSCGYLAETSRRASPVKEPPAVTCQQHTEVVQVKYTSTEASSLLLEPWGGRPPAHRNQSTNTDLYSKVSLFFMTCSCKQVFSGNWGLQE